jgi:hypothetical protein
MDCHALDAAKVRTFVKRDAAEENIVWVLLIENLLNFEISVSRWKAY